LKINEFDEDTLKTLELCDGMGVMNNAATLLSDRNHCKIFDIIRFGDNIDEISERVVLENISILAAYDEAINVFLRYYRKEQILGARREQIEIIPEKAYREALANSLVHRTWDVSQYIQIGMFKDRIEITSPGGLPSNLSEEQFLRGRVSVLRNPIIACVFARLGIIERFGTGIRRINKCYKDMTVKPEFEVYDNSITLVLPTINAVINLDAQEKNIEALLAPNNIMTRGEIENATGMERTKVIRILNRLIDNQTVEKIGMGRGTKYSLRK
jgi:ATP-dependent DNA helicase RecG